MLIVKYQKIFATLEHLIGMKPKTALSNCSLPGLGLKLPWEYIPLIKSSCLDSTQQAEAFVFY